MSKLIKSGIKFLFNIRNVPVTVQLKKEITGEIPFFSILAHIKVDFAQQMKLANHVIDNTVKPKAPSPESNKVA